MSIIAAITTVVAASLSGGATGVAAKEGSGVCRVSVAKGRNPSLFRVSPGDGEMNPDDGEDDDDGGGDPGIGDFG
ncbi:hypothetical protein N7454_003395 [Penicillium verhagenii]|nr:hypothetical protein N7454_003395 [Penicillium verhagenii]